MIHSLRSFIRTKQCYYLATTATVASSFLLYNSAAPAFGSKFSFSRYSSYSTSTHGSSIVPDMLTNQLPFGGSSGSGSSPPFTVLASALEKPELDNRKYKVIKLSNELEALLIQDPETDKASAALDVKVGSFSDPADLQGLAHFCEHLLFMGNEKYPKENEYSEYLSSHSGHSNAYTDTCDTNYYFEVGHEHLEGALDRFAQFFIAPLFLADCKDREIRAVDSENKKNLQSDMWRLHQLDKALANPDHPFSNFSTGNLDTLEVWPTAKGIDVRDELLKFHAKYYSANVMKLVVLGREPLDVLEQWTIEKFSPVKNNNSSYPKFPGQAFTENEMQKAIFAKPVMDDRSMELTFLFPDQRPFYKSHPAQYFSHLIGHEGQGSILHYLKKKSWANSLSAGSYHICDGSEVFSISVDMTKEGLKEYESIIVAIFQYLKLLRSTPPQEWIYEELRDVAASNFRFRQKASASTTTSRLAAVMQRPLPREWLMSGPALYREFDADQIAKSVEYFTPDAFRFVLTSQEFPGDWDQKEKWYGTEYKVEPLSSELLNKIKNAPESPELHLPGKNEFIATDFSVDKKEIEKPAKNPVLLRDGKDLKLWYKKDDSFWVPKANVYISLRNPITCATPANLVKGRLFMELVSDSLNAYAYDAAIAGLSYSVELAWDGISISAQGFNHKLPILLEKVIEELKDFKVDPERFKVFREQLQQEYKNTMLQTPYQQIGFYTSYLFSQTAFLTEEKLAELESVTAEDVQVFIPQVLRQFNAEILVHGNIQKEDALNIAKLVDETLTHNPLPISLDIRQRSLVLPKGSKFAYKRPLADDKNINSCIEYFCQVCPLKERRIRTTLSVLAQIINEPAFNQLRTKEQLGYVVFSGIRLTKTLAGLRVLIQSEKSTEYLESRIDAFFDKVGDILKQMPADEYEKQVKSIIAKRKEKFKNLNEESNHYWNHISSGYYDFFRDDIDIELLGEIKKEEVIDLFYKYVHKSSKERAAAIVQLQSVCVPPVADLSTLLKSKVTDMWSKFELPADKTLSEKVIEQAASDADPVSALKASFEKLGLLDAWTKNGIEEQITEQIRLSAPMTADEDEKVITDVSLFRSQLEVSPASAPVNDLSMFKEPSAKL
ncbi:a-pheromone processing metallopeptidase Ste23 [Myxozyma melibiosi]|uniref:A-pheromone processing metallopeptidase Ste23 n=1 Tax=Myxozyma melibiosi TaxID=54550 RepID=A0ABR1F9B2_9ASCO